MSAVETIAKANNGIRRWFAPRERVVLGTYWRAGFWQRYPWLAHLVFGLIAILYGAFFGVTSTYFIVQMALPIATLVFIIIWMLPDSTKAPPVRAIRNLFFLFFAALTFWPQYLALALPGLPWITAQRLTVVPMALIYLVTLSQSKAYRRELSTILSELSLVWKGLAIFFVLALMTIGVAGDTFEAVNKYIIALYSWLLIFLIASQVFSRKGSVTAFAFMLWGGAIVVSIIAYFEFRKSGVLWAGHVPAFLKVEDESVQRILSGKVRAATGLYRVQSKFITPLELAEYLVITLPFLCHFVVTSTRISIRVAAALSLPAIIWVIAKTDARLGMVGLFLTLLLYLFGWAIVQRGSSKQKVLPSLIIAAYPVVFLGFIAATFFVRRLERLVWGDGAQQASNAGRQEQISQALPMVAEQPWGHGFGRAADALGFTNFDGVLTIDSYYLSVALETGVLGFLTFFGVFGLAIWKGSKELPGLVEEETSFLLPAIIALINFMAVKSVLSQLENQPYYFCLLGMVMALVYRIRVDRRTQPILG